MTSTTHSSPPLIHGLFPTPLGHYKLNRPLTNPENEFIQSQTQHRNVGNRISTNNQICDSDAMSGLTQFFAESLAHYVKQVHAPASDVHVDICSSWINWSQAGEHHHKHTHPNSFISGVFYVQTNPDDKIWFHDDSHQWIKMELADYTMWNSSSYYYAASQGDLYLFPSSLPHSVATVQGPQERVSISFNTWPQGVLGSISHRTHLVLN